MAYKRKILPKAFGIDPSYLTLVERGDYCLSIEKIIDLSNMTGAATDYILKGITPTVDKRTKDALRGCTEQQITELLEMLKKLAIVIRK